MGLVQAGQAAALGKPVLGGKAERVRVSQLAAGADAECPRAAALLAARPQLQHLSYSLNAKGVTGSKVRMWLCVGGCASRCKHEVPHVPALAAPQRCHSR